MGREMVLGLGLCLLRPFNISYHINLSICYVS